MCLRANLTWQVCANGKKRSVSVQELINPSSALEKNGKTFTQK